MDLNGVTADTKLASTQTHIVAVVLQVNESPKDASHVVIHARMKLK